MNWKGKLLFSLFIIFVIAILVGFIAVEIYVWIHYGGKPIDEIPAWALIFLFGRIGS